MKVNNKPNFFKRLLNDKTKMSFIIIALTLAITTAILAGLIYGKVGDLHENLGEYIRNIPAIVGASFTIISTFFALLRNGTKTREQKTLEVLEAIKTLHTKLTIINKQVKKLKKGKDNG